MLDNYNIRDDYYVEMYFEDKDLSDETAKTYEKDLIKFCLAVNKELKNIIDDCKAQQEIETEEILSSINDDGTQVVQKRVKKFDVDGADSLILQHFKQFKKYCKSRGNKNTTINSGLDTIKAVLSYFKVDLPNFSNLEDDSADWEVLTKDDFKFVLADSSLMHKSLILFMLSSGFRIYDCLNLTIGEYMEATSDFHDFVEVEDFIDNAPDDMRGYWDFEPHKTEKKHTMCKTFNSEESNRVILQNLRRIKNEYMPKKSKRIKKELKLTKSDSLFGSKQGYYTKSPSVQSISTMFGHKNKKLYAWHINKINQDIKDGKISAEDYDKKIKLIPKFHAHACRKYFCTIVERHTSNERRYRLMEGHAPKNKLDKSYIDISKKEIAEIYDEAVDDLSVYYTDEKELEKIREEMKEQTEIHKQEIESINAKHEQEMQSLRKELEQSIDDLNQKIDESQTIIPMYKVKKVIESYLNSIGEYSNERLQLLEFMVLEYYQNNPSEFKDTDESLINLVRKLDVKIEFSKKTISEQSYDIMSNIRLEVSQEMFLIMDNLFRIVSDNENITKRIGRVDMDRFDYFAEKYLVESNIDLSNITDEQLEEIAMEVTIMYLDSIN